MTEGSLVKPVSRIKEKYFQRGLWIAVTFVSFGAAVFLIGVGLHLKREDAENEILAAAVQQPHLPNCPSTNGPVQATPHPEFCNQFYKCENGTLTLETCESGLLYDGRGLNIHNHCNYDWAVDCGDRNLRYAVPWEKTPGCAFAWGIFPHPKPGCGTSYIKCAHGEPYEEACAPGLAYDDHIHSCNWPDLLLPECDPEEIVGFKCPTDLPSWDPAAKFLPYPRFATGNCKTLITCVNGYPRLITCEEEKVFNRDTLTCDYPEKVPVCADYYKKTK